MNTKPVALVLVLMLAFSFPLLAQTEEQMDVTITVDKDDTGHKKVFVKKVGPGLDLTDDQQGKAKDFKLDHEKEVLLLKNELRVKRLDLRIAMKDKDNINMGTVHSLVDEIHKLNAELEKKKITHDLKFRSLLTDEQKKKYDARNEMDKEIRIMKHKIGHGPGGEEMLWFGDGGERLEILKDLDIDKVDDLKPPKVNKKGEMKKRM